MTYLKKILFFILFIFNLFTKAYTQTLKGWGTALSSNFSGRILDFSNTTFTKTQIQNIQDVQTVLPSTALNLFGWYQVKNWNFKFGAGYNHWSGFKSKKYILPAGAHSIAFGSILKQDVYRAKQVYFPIQVNYMLKASEKSHFLFGVETALVWNSAFNHIHYNFNNYSRRVLTDLYLKPLPDYSLLDMYVGVSTGIQTRLSTHYQIAVESYFRYFASEYNTLSDKLGDYLHLKEATKGHLWNAGLQVSLLRSL